MRARIALAAVLAVVALGIAAPAACATISLTPSSADFGVQAFGSTSGPQHFSLTASCDAPDPSDPTFCSAPESATPSVSTTGDFAQTNDCPPMLFTNVFVVPMSCTIDVTFTPTAVGARTGTLSAGGQSSSLSGTGLALPVQPQAVDVKAAIRKCKKKFPKGPKRKKCIKRAKSVAY